MAVYLTRYRPPNRSKNMTFVDSFLLAVMNEPTEEAERLRATLSLDQINETDVYEALGNLDNMGFSDHRYTPEQLNA